MDSSFLPAGKTDDARFEIYYIAFYDFWKEYMPRLLFFSGIIFLVEMLIAALIAKIMHMKYCKAFEMNEYRRNLTASLAHDLKSPLMAISSYSENLLNDVQPEKKHHYSKAILENTQYMDNIIVNVLELSRLETHEKTKRKFIDLTALAKELLDGMLEQLDARSLTASVSGSCIVKADCEMMKQAIRNLLDNAVKFTPEGGSITVTGEKQSLSIVNDIAEEQINDPQRLSEAFVKGDEARSNRMGTGLGLSIVQQIAAQNRVRLHIDSSMHQFRVKLSQRAPIRLKHKRMARRETMDLTPLAGELLAGMQEQLDTRGLKISVSGRCIVNVERQMLTQSLRDLLNNAVKYTPEGGCITVTGKKHKLSIVSDMKAGLDQSNDAGSKCNSIEPALAAVQQTAAQNQIKLRIDSSDHQLRMQLKQNTLFSPICFRKIN
jgi:signal transduction histidine kinase